ncbi:hypothetical protein Tco_1476818 [Tanacetum coccineum]
MEKLRQRHKVEKQRAAMFSGERFFSSWFYFEAMEAMDPGPEPGSGLKSGLGRTPDPVRGSRKVASFRTVTFETPFEEQNLAFTRVAGKEKRKGGGMADVVTSIRLLGDGFMKMEKMKIDMAKEIEKMRMDTEMKRNQLILESQRQIIEAFVNGVVEARKRGLALAFFAEVVGRRFMKMEIDMAKEIEKMRIETEVKFNELKLESQKDRSWDLVNNLVPRKVLQHDWLACRAVDVSQFFIIVVHSS